MSKQKDNWPQLVQLAKAPDGMPVREGNWGTFGKLYWWNRYISITTKAMAENPRWNGLAYVDLFAGPGILEDADHGRMPGSPMIAAHASKPFSRIVCVEKKRQLAKTCHRRLHNWGVGGISKVIGGDYNAVIDEVIDALPERCLTTALIDPTGLHIHFETVRRLTSGRAVDLLILLADTVDLFRNVSLYEEGTCKNLDLMLGEDSGWRMKYQALNHVTDRSISNLLSTVYERQLRSLGYVAFDCQPIRTRSRNQKLYTIMFATKNPRGLDFWAKCLEKERDGNRLL